MFHIKGRSTFIDADVRTQIMKQMCPKPESFDVIGPHAMHVGHRTAT